MRSKNNTKFNSGKIIKFITLTIFVFVFSANFVFASDINSDNILKLINQERTIRGIPTLKTNDELNQAASLKSKDMINRSYFDHYAFGLTPWDFIKNSGYDYLYAGENLAMDFNTSEGTVKAWMNSPAHRDNILNPDFTETGIGVVKGEYTEKGFGHSTTMISNMFGRQKPTILKAFDYIAKNFFGAF